MLGAGERRLVLLDFLLMVLREARTGSSDMCGYREVEGREGTVHQRGGNGEFTPIPRPASLPSTPDGGSFRQLQPLPSGGLPPVPGIASARTAAVFRPALAAHLPPPPSLLLLSPSRCSGELGAGTRPPRQLLRGRSGAWAGSAGSAGAGHSPGGHAGMPRAPRHAPFCKPSPHPTQEGARSLAREGTPRPCQIWAGGAPHGAPH